MKKHELENKIEAVIDSLDHVCRVGPGPFFYTRVHARLHGRERTLWEKVSGFLAQPAVAFTVVCLVISLNTLVIVQSETVPRAGTEQNAVTPADESELDVVALYDDEPINTDLQ